MASVQKRGEGRYIVRWREYSGAPEQSQTFRKRHLADAYRSKIETELNQGTYVDPNAGKERFGVFAERWMKDQPWRKTTYDRQESAYRTHIRPTFGNRPISSLRTSEIRGWAMRLEVADSTRQSILRTMSAILAGAVGDKVIGSNPAEGVKVPAADKALVRPLTVADVRKLVEAAPPHLRAAVVLASTTGLRQGELFGITEDRIQWIGREIRIDRQLVSANNGKVHFGPPKSKRSVRDVPVTDHAMKALAEHVDRFGFGPEGHLFTNTKKTPVRRNTASESFKKIAASAKVEAKGWHDLRHHAASVLIDGGLSVTAVAAVLGHSPDVCLKTYAHWWPNENEQIRSAVAQAWAKADRLADSTRDLAVVE